MRTSGRLDTEAISVTLDHAVERGIVDRGTADRILAVAELPDVPALPPHPPERHLPATIEGLAYVGATLVVIGAVVLVSQHWQDLSSWARPSLLAATAIGLFATGAAVGADAPLTWRLRNIAWLVGLGATAGTLAVLTADVGGWSGSAVAVTVGGGVALLGAGLWRNGDLPLVHAATFVGLHVAVGGVLGGLDGAAAVGVGMIAVGFTWLFLAERRLLLPRWTGIPLGMIATLVGPQVTFESWRTTAPLIGLAVAIGFTVAGATLHRLTYTAGGVAGLLLYLPLTVARFFGDAGGPATVLFVSGAVLLAVAVTLVRRGTRRSGG